MSVDLCSISPGIGCVRGCLERPYSIGDGKGSVQIKHMPSFSTLLCVCKMSLVKQAIENKMSKMFDVWLCCSCLNHWIWQAMNNCVLCIKAGEHKTFGRVNWGVMILFSGISSWRGEISGLAWSLLNAAVSGRYSNYLKIFGEWANKLHIFLKGSGQCLTQFILLSHRTKAMWRLLL